MQGLEHEKWVSKTIVPQNGRPDKNVYAITAAGQTELLRWLGDEDLGLRIKTPILMKVFFMGERSVRDNIHYFESVIKSCEVFLKSLESVPQYIDTYSDIIEQKGKTLYWQMTAEYGRQSMQMQIKWAQDCIRRLEGK